MESVFANMKRLTLQPLAVALLPRVEVPVVTIAIPTLGRIAHLKEAIDSALQQRTETTYEVIVVDNGSDPKTREAVEKYVDPRLGYFQNSENLGMTGNWNQCIALARGKQISILHDDDALADSFLESAEALLRQTNCRAYACANMFGKEIPTDWPAFSHVGVKRTGDLLWGSLNGFPGVLFEVEVARSLDGFDASWYPCSDYEFWKRLLKITPCAYEMTPRAFYRQSSSQTSSDVWSDIVRRAHTIRLQCALEDGIPRIAAEGFARYASWQMARGYRSIYTESALRTSGSVFLEKVMRALWRGIKKVSIAFPGSRSPYATDDGTLSESAVREK